MGAIKSERQEFRGLEQQLETQREKLRSRFAEQRTNVYIDREPDDEGAEANRNLTTHLLLTSLDRERRVLGEIELALDRMKSGEYGVCDICGVDIPQVRLQAVPWTRYCVKCAERSPTPQA